MLNGNPEPEKGHKLAIEEQDNQKRKRETSFSPSSEGQRVQRKQKRVQAGDMDEVKNIFKTLMEEIAEMKRDQRAHQTEVTTLREENQKLTEKLERVEQHLEKLEKAERRNNIVIKGGKLQGSEITAEVEELLKNKVGIQTKIQDARLVSEKYDIVVAKIENWDTKRAIMKQKNKLKGSKTFIEDDYTKQESEIQKKIRGIAAAEKGKGVEAKVGYKKMIWAGEVWHWDTKLDKLVKAPSHPKENPKN
ncbi:hypothetical protein Zmor_021901 [Zophobas morio]|uniref:Uncharacterized protein n=1 Tax=Zophobas morio TaxID=2755281 RepID=A0AA38MBG2_9CUCU|nr:hypothetical protein Zmor_021901 [Zophobas morio]